jgi:hypothetical protein
LIFCSDDYAAASCTVDKDGWRHQSAEEKKKIVGTGDVKVLPPLLVLLLEKKRKVATFDSFAWMITVKLVYDIFHGTTIRVAHEGSLIEWTRALHAKVQ